MDTRAQTTLYVDQGAPLLATFTIRNGDGQLRDFTGKTARGEVRSAYADAAPGEPAATLTVTLGGAAGTLSIALDADSTEELTAPVYRYDVEVLGAGDAVEQRILAGPLYVSFEVTR